MDKLTKMLQLLRSERYRYPILALLIGILLMLLPFGSTNHKEEGKDPVSQMLSRSRGVGECVVLISESGVVVVCEGADNAKVRLEIIQALGSYTGYSSDQITILKMVE